MKRRRTLYRHAQAGDRQARRELLDQTYPRIYGYLRRICGDPDDAEDLTQETFLRVWRALDRYQGRCAFATWVYAIAHHVYVDWRRRRRPDETTHDAWWTETPSQGPEPPEIAHQQHQAQQLWQRVAELDETRRQAVHLHYYEGLSLRETAYVLDMPLSTLKYRLRQALRTLATRLRPSRADTTNRVATHESL